MPRVPHPALIPDAGRLDQWLVAHGHAATRREAQAAIMAGLVTVDGQVADKPGRRITPRMQVAVQRRDDAVAAWRRQRPTRAEVFLHVDDQQCGLLVCHHD